MTENLTMTQMADDIVKAVKTEYSSLNMLNVLILGKTGVGKSTLINSVFSENLAATGTGRPITEHIQPLRKNKFPLTIYDTPGLELSGGNSAENLLNEVSKLVKKGINSGSVDEAIHCIWYCISTPSHRIESSEIEFLKKLFSSTTTRNVPIIIILTQSYSKKDAKALMCEIQKERLPVERVVPVLAADYELDEDDIKKAYGLENLVDIMYQLIPEAVQSTFAAVQKSSIQLKKKEAHSIVAKAATKAAITGAVPIPFPDAAILVPEQISMLAKITSIFGIPMQKATLTAVLSAMIGTTGATNAGRAIVGTALKFIPGAGSVVGGAISAATASALTAALGEAYIVIMTGIASGEFPLSILTSPEGKKKMSEIFKAKLTNTST